ncbi:hypothetical protein FRC01_013100 [Tulasnella sp. 417]|nr:hypothetical protein FRC01_013100 [Tulasnella sp. 417]
MTDAPARVSGGSQTHPALLPSPSHPGAASLSDEDEYELGDVTIEELEAAEVSATMSNMRTSSISTRNEASSQAQLVTGQEVATILSGEPASLNSNPLPTPPCIASAGRESLEAQQSPDQDNPSGSARTLGSLLEGPTTPHRIHSTDNLPIGRSTSPERSSPCGADPVGLKADDSQWSTTHHRDWIPDSLISDVFHPPVDIREQRASSTSNNSSEPNSQIENPSDLLGGGGGGGIHGGGGGESKDGAGNENEADDATGSPPRQSTTSESENEEEEEWVDPFGEFIDGVFGAEDVTPIRYCVHLLDAPAAEGYSPIIRLLLGDAAYGYMVYHYFSPGSALVVLEAYQQHSQSPRLFVECLRARGMAPRHAGYLWRIIRPHLQPDAGDGHNEENTPDIEYMEVEVPSPKSAPQDGDLGEGSRS